jgi:hypothetical protein
MTRSPHTPWRMLQLKPLNQRKYKGNVTRFNTIMYPLYTHVVQLIGLHISGELRHIKAFFLLIAYLNFYCLNRNVLWFIIVLVTIPISLLQ